MKKVGFISLGCPKNLVDSEVMMGQLKQNGYEITPNAADADIVVVNTCGFIDSAKKESIDTILEAAQLKLNGQAQRLVVAGCLVERYRDELKAEIRKSMLSSAPVKSTTSSRFAIRRPTRARFPSYRSAIKARPISTMIQLRVCWRRRRITRS